MTTRTSCSVVGLWWKYWFHDQVVLVNQLFNRDGLLFTYEDFLTEYNLPVTAADDAKVFGAVSSGIFMLFTSQPRRNLQQVSLLSPADTLVGKGCFSIYSRNNNRSIRALFQKDIPALPQVISHWNNSVELLYGSRPGFDQINTELRNKWKKSPLNLFVDSTHVRTISDQDLKGRLRRNVVSVRSVLKLLYTCSSFAWMGEDSGRVDVL